MRLGSNHALTHSGLLGSLLASACSVPADAATNSDPDVPKGMDWDETKAWIASESVKFREAMEDDAFLKAASEIYEVDDHSALRNGIEVTWKNRTSKVPLNPRRYTPPKGEQSLNSRCSCGSGLKYKRCHGKHIQSLIS